MSDTSAMPEALAHDWRQLVALVDATAERQAIPCRSVAADGPSPWVANGPAEQSVAARACRTCPVLIACRRYGLDHPKEVGVYGGLTFAQRRNRGAS